MQLKWAKLPSQMNVDVKIKQWLFVGKVYSKHGDSSNTNAVIDPRCCVLIDANP